MKQNKQMPLKKRAQPRKPKQKKKNNNIPHAPIDGSTLKSDPDEDSTLDVCSSWDQSSDTVVKAKPHFLLKFKQTIKKRRHAKSFVETYEQRDFALTSRSLRISD